MSIGSWSGSWKTGLDVSISQSLAIMGVSSDHSIRSVVVRMGGIEMQINHLPYAYFEGDIVPIGEAKISVASQVVQYGSGVFAGIRGYLDQDGSTINIF